MTAVTPESQIESVEIPGFKMRMVYDYPPNFEELKPVFNVEESAQVAFAYGQLLYNPYKFPLRPDCVFHEQVHMEQQGRLGGPVVWWKRYIAEPGFRISQEIEAYGQQVKYIRRTMGDKRAIQALNSFCKYISSDVYGKAITEGAALLQLGRASRR